MQVELSGNSFNTVGGVDVLDQGDLVASRCALPGGDGRVGKEIFPDLLWLAIIM
jgi:hypothetical protein